MDARCIRYLKSEGAKIRTYKTINYYTYDCEMEDGTRICYYGTCPMCTIANDGEITIRLQYPIQPSHISRINQFLHKYRLITNDIKYKYSYGIRLFEINGRLYEFHRTKTEGCDIKPFRIKNEIPMDVAPYIPNSVRKRNKDGSVSVKMW